MFPTKNGVFLNYALKPFFRINPAMSKNVLVGVFKNLRKILVHIFAMLPRVLHRKSVAFFQNSENITFPPIFPLLIFT